MTVKPMKQLFVPVAVLLAWAIGTQTAVPAQSKQPRVRTLAWSPDAPIPGRLLPDDEVVRVKLQGDLDYIVPGHALTPDEVIEDLAVRADLVAVIHVTSLQGFLSQHDTWVSTRLTGTVREVIRERKAGEFQGGQRLEAVLSGGEVVIGNVRVQLGDPQPLPLHQSSLLFLHRREGSLAVDHLPVVIEKGKLRYPRRQQLPPELKDVPANAIQGLTLAVVRRVVKEATTSWMCGKCEP